MLSGISDLKIMLYTKTSGLPSLTCREAFLSSADVASYKSVSDNMASALPRLSDVIQTDVFSVTLPVPQPLETRGCQVGLSHQPIMDL